MSKEYGWTDDQILDLPMCRVRQARDVIEERRAEQKKEDLRVREQELRWVCGMVAASAGNAKGAKQASRIELFERELEERDLPSPEQIMRMFPEG